MTAQPFLKYDNQPYSAELRSYYRAIHNNRMEGVIVERFKRKKVTHENIDLLPKEWECCNQATD